MGSYIGSQRSSSVTTVDSNFRVSGLNQMNSITQDITVPSSQNLIFFGDTTFNAGTTITVNGQLIIAGGSPDFQSDVTITGTLYAY